MRSLHGFVYLVKSWPTCKYGSHIFQRNSNQNGQSKIYFCENWISHSMDVIHPLWRSSRACGWHTKYSYWHIFRRTFSRLLFAFGFLHQRQQRRQCWSIYAIHLAAEWKRHHKRLKCINEMNINQTEKKRLKWIMVAKLSPDQWMEWNENGDLSTVMCINKIDGNALNTRLDHYCCYSYFIELNLECRCLSGNFQMEFINLKHSSMHSHERHDFRYAWPTSLFTSFCIPRKI